GWGFKSSWARHSTRAARRRGSSPLPEGGVMRNLRILALVAAAGAVALALPAAAEKKATVDRVWTSPDLAQFPVPSIALLPTVTCDGSVEARRLVEQAVGKALRGSGHRWVSAAMARDELVKAGGGGDSLLKALNNKVLKNPRLDS